MSQKDWKYFSDGKEKEEIGKTGKKSIHKINKFREVLAERELDDLVNEELFGRADENSAD